MRDMTALAPILIAAALTASCSRPDTPPPRTVRTDTVLPNETRITEAVIPRHATLESVLATHDLPAATVQMAIASARSVFDPRDLRTDRPYKIVQSLDGSLREFEYQIDADRYLRIVDRDHSEPQQLEAEVLAYDKEVEVVTIRGQIDAAHPSLIAAMDGAGEGIQLAIALAEIFGGEIDFQNDLQPADSFDVMVEKSTYEGEFAGYGAIIGARFTNEGREHRAYRWVDPSTSKAAYYDDEGRSLKRFFLASPLRFTPRVTSGFSRARLHPVHRSYRPHLGVDYAAPTGAPVVAVADGVVVSAGWAGGGGRQVRIRHFATLESYYLHLSAFARGLRAGARVSQGQLIGLVGASGTATGPHLDYRLRKNGAFVDPRREHAGQPPGDPIPTRHLPDFLIARDAAALQLTAAPPIAAAAQTPVLPEPPSDSR